MTEGMNSGEYMAEAVSEYAREHGKQDPEAAWILSPFDTWERNPAYSGPEVPHPESEEAAMTDAPMMEWTILTNAPEVYDYGLTVKFSNPVLGSKGLRLVECYTEEEEGPGARFRMESQAARYQSGLYVGLVEPSREDYEWYSKRY